MRLVLYAWAVTPFFCWGLELARVHTFWLGVAWMVAAPFLILWVCRRLHQGSTELYETVEEDL